MIVKNVNKIGLSKGIYSALQLEQCAVFFFHLDQIGPSFYTPTKRGRRRRRDTYNSYDLNDQAVINVFDDYQYDEETNYEYMYEDEEQTDSVNNQWLCLSETSFQNVRLSEASLVQIHFTQIDMSVSILEDAFSELQVDENAKFQIMFQDVRGHIVFDREAVNMVKLKAGLFEIWIDNHQQRGQSVNETGVSVKFNSKHKSKQPAPESLSSTKNALKILNSAKNNYFKLFDSAINKIYLNSRSNFRIGYLNSKAVMSVSSKSIRNFHIDRYLTL